MTTKSSDKYLQTKVRMLKKSATKYRGDIRPGKRRFGLYKFLVDVYECYLELEANGNARKASRRMAKLLQLPTEKKSHPIRVLIEAGGGAEDNRQKSRWTQALRYAAGWRQPPARLEWFFSVNGGIAGCARKQAMNNAGRKERKAAQQPDNIINEERTGVSGMELAAAAHPQVASAS